MRLYPVHLFMLTLTLTISVSSVWAQRADKARHVFLRLHENQYTQTLPFADVNRAELPATLVKKDYLLLKQVAEGIDEFHVERTAIANDMGDSPVFLPKLDDRMKAAFASYRRHRKALLRFLVKYAPDFDRESELNDGPSLLQKRILVGYASSLFLFSSALRLTSEYKKPSNKFWKKFDEPELSDDYKGGELSALWRVVTNRKNIKKLAQARKAYLAAYPEVIRKEREQHWLHRRIAQEHAFLDENAPSLWLAKVAQLWQSIVNTLHKPYYRIFSAVSIWVGDTKYLNRPPTIGHDRIAEMTAQLQPGDILLERENYWMSNAFLPGFWPHGIVYVGTVDDIKALGLDKDPRVAQHLANYALPDAHGHTRRVIEAISEGVCMSSMEEATDADYICAFRPRVPLEVKKEAIARAFSLVGKPYDFAFDFFTADKIVCTEVVHRSYSDYLEFDLSKIAGHWALTAGDIIDKFTRELDTPSQQLDFIFFLDSNYKTRETWFDSAEALIKSNERPGLAFLSKD